MSGTETVATRSCVKRRSCLRPSVALVALLAVLALSSEAGADHGRGVRWAPATVKVGDCTSPRWRGAVRAAVIAWDRAPGLAVRRVRCEGGHFRVRSGYYGRGWAGLAPTRTSAPGTLFWAKVQIENRYHRESIVCHELGHALGLGHSNRRRSCMWPGPSRGERPTRHDLLELGRQYAPQPPAGTAPMPQEPTEPVSSEPSGTDQPPAEAVEPAE